MGSAPGPRPLFCKKAGQKTFRRQSTSSPSPSPLGRVIQSVREADTLAAEWHLPREWERRVGPETSRGRHHPKRFSLGLHPVSLGKTKEMGWNRQHQRKVHQDKSASSTRGRVRPRPAGAKGGTPGEGPPFDPLLRFVEHRRVPRAAARVQGSAPGPRPLFCKKAGQKTFKPQGAQSPSRKSQVRYWMASARCAGWMSRLAARSAIVRATRRMRS